MSFVNNLLSPPILKNSQNTWPGGDSIQLLSPIISDLSTLAAGIDAIDPVSGTLTADVITPKTSGAGTSSLVPSLVRTTTAFAPTLSGGVYMLSKVDGLTVALPVITAATVGMRFKFHIGLTCTSVGYVITAGAGSTMLGMVYGTIAHPDAGNDAQWNIATSTNNTLTLGATTACGLAGGWVEFTAVSTTVWAVNGMVLGSGTISSTLFTTV